MAVLNTTPPPPRPPKFELGEFVNYKGELSTIYEIISRYRGEHGWCYICKQSHARPSETTDFSEEELTPVIPKHDTSNTYGRQFRVGDVVEFVVEGTKYRGKVEGLEADLVVVWWDKHGTEVKIRPDHLRLVLSAPGLRPSIPVKRHQYESDTEPPPKPEYKYMVIWAADGDYSTWVLDGEHGTPPTLMESLDEAKKLIRDIAARNGYAIFKVYEIAREVEVKITFQDPDIELK